mmetsp:Transcript_149766/g.259358  ORF Transcript_149766/g.259358 Transcript_149766/m.259358 type:complete len:428 (+) Transcript_149766:62-1345(+)
MHHNPCRCALVSALVASSLLDRTLLAAESILLESNVTRGPLSASALEVKDPLDVWDFCDLSKVGDAGHDSCGISLIQHAAFKIKRPVSGKQFEALIASNSTRRNDQQFGIWLRARLFSLTKSMVHSAASSRRLAVMVSGLVLCFCSSLMCLFREYVRRSHSSIGGDQPKRCPQPSDLILVPQAAADGQQKGTFEIVIGGCKTSEVLRVDCQACNGGAVDVYDQRGYQVQKPLSGPNIQVQTHIGEAAHLPDANHKYFLVHNGRLQSQSRGVAYRGSMNLKDRIRNAVAVWDSVVVGRLIDNDWLQVNHWFLPTRVDGIPVLMEVKQPQSEEARNMVISRTDGTIEAILITHCIGKYSVLRTGQPDLIMSTKCQGDERLEIKNRNGRHVGSASAADEAGEEFLQLSCPGADTVLVLSSIAALRHSSAW